ncbi:MAG: pur operon repressor [Lachnospiraceae bacterium]|nr:pur operon repressor [Lachnospiraceae bacterium]
MYEVATRKERLTIITTILTSNPNHLYSLSYFSELFGSAKSTLSEDIAIIKESLKKYGKGEVEVLMGAGGGVRYLPINNTDDYDTLAAELTRKLSNPNRILPGGFIYTADIFYNPYYVDKMSKALWSSFSKTNPDFIITAEAKGIPLAMGVAKLFDKPLVVARRESKVTEGSVVTINYVSGTSRRIQTMSLSKRSVSEGQKTIIIDDFIAGGGTVRAIFEMMKEFQITVFGCGCAIATKEPERKRIENYKSLFTLEKIEEETQTISIKPNF